MPLLASLLMSAELEVVRVGQERFLTAPNPMVLGLQFIAFGSEPL